DPPTREWSNAQKQYARRYLDALPTRPAIYEQLKQLFAKQSARYSALTWRGGLLFAMKHQPPNEQPVLVTLRSADDPESEHVVIDPNQLDPKGGTGIDFYIPSHNGTYVAVSISKGGSESGDVHVY